MKSSGSLFWVAAFSGWVRLRAELAPYLLLAVGHDERAASQDSHDWYTWRSISEASGYASYNGLTRYYNTTD